MRSKISIVRCNNYEPTLVLEATKKALDSLGGISAFIAPKSRVLVKPNLLMAKEPEFGIDTHPEIVRAAVRILKEINCKIYLGDGPSVWGSEMENVDEVYRRSGVKKICEEEGIELVKFDKRRWRGKFPLAAWLDNCDYVLNLPKFKTHDFMLMTGAIKNLFGLVSGTYKTELHKKYFAQEDFAKILVDIYEETRPALTIIDSIVAMEGDGPGTSGELRKVGLILAGSDCVALDSILALIMGLKPQDILTTKEAASRGSGAVDINSISILGEKLENIIEEPFKLPTTSLVRRIPRPVIELAKKLIKYYPCVEYDDCISCAACIQACPNKIITMKKDRPVFDYAKCTACFCCQEACPNAAIKIKRNIWAKMAGL
ncbi:MAG: hypothetical protein COX40_02240 [Candidatus Omnitrophica bacterium CG23_combo_of_CG06-09_8_20_14_all_40_11]|nr:MAG: hypothetical protein COX40_02240 [Candidatus Omnitrophica bacterium CG23_combo_of_CG06-09_8_20_14_all_40_11]